ncbi:glycosyltransferase [Sphingobacterium thalpophilum]|uniref:glycosyltransferase n=1 Tax=Sphingobacterium thalpophilum TaxID=259 RepID=UPI0037D998B4
MKIQLFFIDYYKKNLSGLSTYVKQLTDCLSERSEIRLSYININSKFNIGVEKELVEDVVHYQYPKELQISETNLNNSLIHLLKNDIIPDLPIIFHFNWINHAPFAQILKKNFECVTLLTKHCIPWRDNIVGNYNLFKRLNDSFLAQDQKHFIDHALYREYIAYTSVDHIICVTDFAKRSLIKMFGINDDKLSVVYNGLKVTDSPKKTKGNLRIEYGFSISDKIILFAGNINIRKGVVDLVESFKLLVEKTPNAHLIIAGKGNYDAVVSVAGKFWSKITITGNLDKETLLDFYHMADVGVVPSYIEQCSYTAIEMMHAGLPIVVTNVDGLAEIVPENGSLRVPLLSDEKDVKVDVIELKNAIKRLLENPADSSQFAKIAKTHALEKLTSDVMAYETVKVYRDLAEESLELKYQICSGSKSFGKIVIMVCFEPTLEDYRATVNNILEQKYTDIEVIFFIPESNLGHFTAIGENEKINIRFVTVPKQRSIVSVLNENVQECKEQFISIVSKKEMMRADRFEKQINTLLFDATLDFVGSDCFILDEGGNRSGLKQYPRFPEDCEVLNMFQNAFELTSVLFRANSLKKVKFKSFAYRIDEAKFWFELLKKQKGLNLRECLTSIYPDKRQLGKSNDALKNHIAEIIQSQFQYYKIEIDIKELALHLAIYFGYKKLYFNNDTKKELLAKWLDKLFAELEGKINIKKSALCSYIRQHLCDVA